MFKLQGYDSSAAKMRQNPPAQIAQKVDPEEPDSADDLEDIGNENVAVFNKIPESQVKQNQPLFLNRTKSDAGPFPKERIGSPFKEKNVNNQPKSGTLPKDDQTEAIRKMIYTKSPKEAAYEYMSSGNKHMKKPNQDRQIKTSRTTDSPQRNKSYPYPFNSGSGDNQGSHTNREGASNYSSPKGFEKPEMSAYSELSNKIYADRFYNQNQPRRMNVGNSPDQKPSLLLSMHAALNIEEKKYLASKGQQDEMTNRLVQDAEIKNQHKRALANSYLSKEREECTFAPRILTGGPRRNFNQFLEDQKQHKNQTEMKKNALKEQIKAVQAKEEGTFKPTLCANSMKMLEKKKRVNVSKSPVHERLYNIGKNAHTKMMRNIAEKGEPTTDRGSIESSNFVGPISGKESLIGYNSKGKDKEELSFIPTIDKKSKNIKRNERIDSLLYSDALRRQNKVAESTKPKTKSISAQPQTMSLASKKAIATRFIKEFDIGILEYLDEGKGSKLNYIQCNEFLRKLRFLKESEQFDSPKFTPERILLYDMWYILYGDKSNGIHRRNLLVFLLAVLNLHFPITKIQINEENNEEEDEVQGPGLITDEEGHPLERKVAGFFDDDGNYFLTEEDVRRIHQIYDLWYINRLCSSDNIGQLISARSYEEYTHTPAINESSRTMAQTYREKILEGTVELIQQNIIPAPKDGKLTHADLLNVSKKITEEKVNRYGELMKEEKSKDCTFKPQTTHYEPGSASLTMRSGYGENNSELRSPQSSKRNAMPATSLGKDRGLELYSLAKPRVLRKDKDNIDYDYEKNYEECTFQPNINSHRSPRSFIGDRNETVSKGADKAVDRVRTAQVEKEHNRLWKERGFSTGTEGHFVFSLDKHSYNRTGPPHSARKSTKTKTPREEASTNRYYEPSSAQRSNFNEVSPQLNQREREENSRDDYLQGYNNGGYEVEHEEEYGHDQREGDNTEEYNNPYPEERYNQGTLESGMKQNMENEGNEEDERVPLLFVDVNLGQGRTERIVVHEGDQSDDLALKFCHDFGLDPMMKSKLKELLDSQMAGLLAKINEEENSTVSDTERRRGYENGGHIQEEDDYEDEHYRRR